MRRKLVTVLVAGAALAVCVSLPAGTGTGEPRVRRPAGRVGPGRESTGGLTVCSVPAGVEIVLDGEPAGVLTPFTFPDLEPGQHTVTVLAPAARDVPVVTLSLAGHDLILELILRRDAPSRAYLREDLELEVPGRCRLEYYYSIPEGFESQSIRPAIITLHGSQSTQGTDDQARRATAEMHDLWTAAVPGDPDRRRNVREHEGESIAFAVAAVRWWYDTPCWVDSSGREDRYLSYHELAQAVALVAASLAGKGANPAQILLHGLSRGGERTWAVTCRINAGEVFRTRHVLPLGDTVGSPIEIALAFPHGGACGQPCLTDILGLELEHAGRCRLFPYAGDADRVEFDSTPGCSPDTNPDHQPSYYGCPWRLDAMLETWRTLSAEGLSVATPRLGRSCPADGAGADDQPVFWGHELTRVYPGCPPYPYQDPGHCAHPELDDTILDELFATFFDCLDGDCDPAGASPPIPGCG